MTNEQWEKYANEGMHTAAQLLTEEIENEHTIKEWIKNKRKCLIFLNKEKLLVIMMISLMKQSRTGLSFISPG